MGTGRLKRQRGNTELTVREMQEQLLLLGLGEQSTEIRDYQNLGAWGKEPDSLGTQALRRAIAWLIRVLQELRGDVAPSWAVGGRQLVLISLKGVISLIHSVEKSWTN